jgi:hypothetical protein
VNWFWARGANLAGVSSGHFQEVNVDAVYLSRFQSNTLAYSQFRPGYRLPSWGGVRAQAYWNFNFTVDRQRAYWANFVETGPGFRFRLPAARHPLEFSVNFVRGVHLVNESNPRRPNYFDLRIGLWYAFAL